MVLGKIIAGFLAILSDWDVVGVFVAVNLTGEATIDRTSSTCVAVNTTATLTNCGQSLSDWIVAAISGGIAVLSTTVSGLHV